MAVLRIYPASVVSGNGFTTTELANVLGNTTGYATHTSSQAAGTSLGGTFTFPFSSLPSNLASVTNISAGVLAKANQNAGRRGYSFEVYNGSTICFKTEASGSFGNLTTTDTTVTTDTTGASVFNTNVALWRNDSMQVNYTFIALGGADGAVTTYWDKFWLDITYTEAVVTTPNLFYMGENF
ncbi:hypothetical protein [Flavobacterium sp.]|jgi:hypothetical protein|uniref:hypothetical protein n=1 Tax=Flavobacterium sp. TaxID=239 RepID=UPI0037C012CC